MLNLDREHATSTRGGDAHNQRGGGQKITSINNEPERTEPKSQFEGEEKKKQHKMTISISAVSAREIHADLLSPAVTARNYDQETERLGAREGRAACLTDGCCSVSSRKPCTSCLTVKAGCCPAREEAPGQRTHAVMF